MNTLFHWLVQTTWQASILILLVGGVCRLFGARLPAAWQYALWLLVIARLLVPEISLPAHRASMYVVVPETPALAWKAAARSVPHEAAPPSPQPASVAQAKTFAPKPEIWLAGIWLAGVVLGLAAGIARQAMFHRRLRGRVHPAPAPIATLAERCRRCLRIRRRVRVFVTDAVSSPAVVGLWRPAILLPAQTVLERRQLRLVMLHELAHLRRFDLATSLLAGVARLIHWFNPLVWWAVARMNLAREMAVDAFVVGATNRGADYGHTLLRLATVSASVARPALGVMESSGSLRARIAAIVSPRRTALAGTLLGILLVAGLAVFALSRKPETHVVRFEPRTIDKSLYRMVAEGRMEEIEKLAKNGIPPGLLTSAVDSGNAASVRKLLELGTNPNEQDNSNGWTPLMRAAFLGNRLEIARLLLENGADVNILADDGTNAAWQAVEFPDSTDMLRLLIEHGARLDGYDKSGETLLTHMFHYAPGAMRFPNDEAAIRKQAEIERQIIGILADAGVDLEQPSAPGTFLARGTPLMEALYTGHYDMARELMHRGVNILATDSLGNTPIGCLLGRNYFNEPLPLDILDRLLDAGANPNATYRDPGYRDNPPSIPMLKFAMMEIGIAENNPQRTENAKQAIRTLLRRGAKFPEPVDKNVAAALTAIAFGDRDALATAIAQGADPNGSDASGWTPLKLALLLDEPDCVDWLLAHGASAFPKPDRKPSSLWIDNRTPLSFALAKGDDELARKFLASGSIPDADSIAIVASRRDRPFLEAMFATGVTAKDVPLYGCIENGDLETTRLLLDHGADPTGQDCGFGDHVFLAVDRNRPEILRLLLERGADPSHRNINWKKTPLELADYRKRTECAEILRQAAKGKITQ